MNGIQPISCEIGWIGGVGVGELFGAYDGQALFTGYRVRSLAHPRVEPATCRACSRAAGCLMDTQDGRLVLVPVVQPGVGRMDFRSAAYYNMDDRHDELLEPFRPGFVERNPDDFCPGHPVAVEIIASR